MRKVTLENDKEILYIHKNYIHINSFLNVTEHNSTETILVNKKIYQVEELL
jgi:hypothetical protein